MSPSRPAVVYNPTKVDDLDALRRKVTEVLTKRGIPAPTWHETTAEDTGRGQATAAIQDGADLVLVCGGDGTVRACAAALAGSNVELALLPAGTGNLLARNLGIPTNLRHALDVAVDGRARTIDLGELDGEVFAVIAGIGFDAQIFEHTSDALKRRLSWAAYLLAGVGALRDADRVSIELVVDGATHRTDGVGVLVGNVGTLQGGIDVLPDAQPDDGVLDVAVLRPTGVRGWTGLLLRLIGRRQPPPWELLQFTAKEVRITLPHPVAAEADGDLLDERAQVVARVLPNALMVRVP